MEVSNSSNNSPCCIQGCKKYAYYNYEGKTAQYCLEHKKDDMVLPKSRYCVVDNCKNYAYYNLPNEPKRYCKNHKSKNMIDRCHKLCLDCSSVAKYNHQGNKEVLYCYKHKKDKMIKVSLYTCLYIDDNGQKCSKQRRFGTNKAEYCAVHKIEGMKQHTRKICDFIFEDGTQCPDIARYGAKGTKLYCKNHKTDDMKNAIDKKCCYIILNGASCGALVARGSKREYFDYCRKHLPKENAKDGLNICINDYCDNKANKNYKNYCLQCITNIEPLRKGNPKDKEVVFKCTLAKDNMDFIHETPIFIRNVRYDIYKIIDNHIIIIDTKKEKSTHFQYNNYYSIYFNVRVYSKDDEKKAPSSKVLVNKIQKELKNIESCLKNYTCGAETFDIE